ncbi:LacI family DNA-binding transcriptional regulator [Leptothrix sp. BB-4]
MTTKPVAKTAAPRARTRSTVHAGPVTLEMVAQAAGVSPSTVSRILNGTAVVSAAKKQAVDEAIAALGFVPNPVARGLAGGRTLSVGVVALSIDSPFYGVAMRGIEDELGRAGYSPLFVSGHWNVDEELRCIELLKARRVDGIIVLTGRLSDTALRAQARSLPLVVTGRTLKAPGLCALAGDDEAGARLATQHLLDLGHRRIAFIAGDAAHPDAEARKRGHLAALQDAGITPDPALILQGDYHEAGGQQAVERLLQGGRRFTAIFSANDQMALGGLLALHRRGLRVPDDISLIGYDNLAVAQFATPPLTTVHHAGYELGQTAAQAMLSLLSGVKPTQQLAPPRLIVRESTRSLKG